MRKIILLLGIALLFCQLVISLKVINITENDQVELLTEGSDPDNDLVSYAYSEPLDQNGRWQTKYGDAGEYKVTVTASDGNLASSEDILLVVKKKEEAPVILSYFPDKDIILDEGSSEKLGVNASDLNMDTLTYTWYVDDKEAGSGQTFIYMPDFFQEGKHNIAVKVSDGVTTVGHEWAANVNDVDRTKLLDDLHDINVQETETVRLELPDFASYSLEYEITEPVGNDGVWETTYDDAGEYDIEVRLKDKSFENKKNIKITVTNKDRPPVFGMIDSYQVVEQDVVEFTLNASDDDGDSISYSCENLPGGAEFTEKYFKWQTTYDTVTRISVIDSMLDKLHLLSRTFIVKCSATANEVTIQKDITIVVNDVNRAPTMVELKKVNVNEGETLTVEPEISDPDGDKTSISCSGWINKCLYITNYNDAGIYVINVVASDGFLTNSQDVVIDVKDVSRPPVFALKNYTAREDVPFETLVNATDPDGDPVTITAMALPFNATFEKNIFRWRPPFNTTHDISIVKVEFNASDGLTTSKGEMFITVHDKNRRPKIVNATPMAEFTTFTGNPIRFEVTAEDPDEEKLSYLWNFGLFEQYNATSAHYRTFSKPGLKKIKVTATDGEFSDSFEWKVNVMMYEDYLKLFK